MALTSTQLQIAVLYLTTRVHTGLKELKPTHILTIDHSRFDNIITEVTEPDHSTTSESCKRGIMKTVNLNIGREVRHHCRDLMFSYLGPVRAAHVVVEVPC